jgi:hypothetical protein
MKYIQYRKNIKNENGPKTIKFHSVYLEDASALEEIQTVVDRLEDEWIDQIHS